MRERRPRCSIQHARRTGIEGVITYTLKQCKTVIGWGIHDDFLEGNATKAWFATIVGGTNDTREEDNDMAM